MHDTAREYGKAFFNAYVDSRKNLTIIDIGSLDVNGSLRKYATNDSKYIGLDFAEGKSVDVVLEDLYKFPFPDDYADVIVSSSCFEHSQFFWLTFIESLRILKPEGVMYLSVPSNGHYHRYPTDNWRFFPDAGLALSDYARYSKGLNTAVLESFIGNRDEVGWHNFVAVFIKNESFVNLHHNRIYNTVQKKFELTNVWLHGNDEVIQYDGLLETDSLLYQAVVRKEFNKVEELFSKGYNIKLVEGGRSLYAAVEDNSLEIVRLLIEHKANIEVTLSSGSTPLIAAAYFGFDEIVKLLLEHGANKNAQAQGVNAFNAALQKDHPTTAIILSDSQESFCSKIQGSEYEVKYTELCGEVIKEF